MTGVHFNRLNFQTKTTPLLTTHTQPQQCDISQRSIMSHLLLR